MSPEYIWQCLQTFFIVTMRREVLLAFGGHGPGMLVNILQDTRQAPKQRISIRSKMSINAEVATGVGQ